MTAHGRRFEGSVETGSFPVGELPTDVDEAKVRAKRGLETAVTAAGCRLRGVWNYGTPVWEREWDLLIVLDACRYDLFREVAPEFEFVPDEFESTYSPASMSMEWLEVHTAERFREDLRRTALVTGNMHTTWGPEFREPWGYLDEVWRGNWDDEEGTVPAAAVTDATVDYLRNRAADDETDRTIAWYFQPHRPFVPAEWSGGFDIGRMIERDAELHQNNEFERYRDGDLSRERLWEGYAANLRYVLDDVERLLRNVDVESAVITSDHANLLGECGVYEHPRHFPHPALRRVPWVRVDAADERTSEPDYDPSAGTPEEGGVPEDEVQARLRQLGYRE